jgi:hypothetical protein
VRASASLLYPAHSVAWAVTNKQASSSTSCCISSCISTCSSSCSSGGGSGRYYSRLSLSLSLSSSLSSPSASLHSVWVDIYYWERARIPRESSACLGVRRSPRSLCRPLQLLLHLLLPRIPAPCLTLLRQSPLQRIMRRLQILPNATPGDVLLVPPHTLELRT